MRSREAAWTEYWGSVGGSAEGGCLPKALRVDALLNDVWRNAAQPLARGAKVLDLATGDGAVLKAMRSVRPDLGLTGADSAAKLPAGPKGVVLRAGIAMEALPFADDRFALVTSQFGYEYGDTGRAAVEVARVLAPGGRFRFVLHHEAGPIVSHNRGRRRALAWAVDESGLLPKARALAQARGRMAIPTPPLFREAPRDAERLFPAQSVAAEFVTGLWQALELGRQRPAVETVATLGALEAKARNELARIDALCEAASDAAAIARIADQLAAAGLALDAPLLLEEPHGKAPLAWLLTGGRLSSKLYEM